MFQECVVQEDDGSARYHPYDQGCGGEPGILPPPLGRQRHQMMNGGELRTPSRTSRGYSQRVNPLTRPREGVDTPPACERCDNRGHYHFECREDVHKKSDDAFQRTVSYAMMTMASAIVDIEKKSAKHRGKSQDARLELRQEMVTMHDDISNQIKGQEQDLCDRQEAMEQRLSERRH